MPETRQLRALIFDFDHTLTDLGRWVDWRAARDDLEDLYGAAGIDVRRAMRSRRSLSLLERLHVALDEHAGRARAGAIRARAFAAVERHERAAARKVALLPGVAAALAAAAEWRLDLAIVSANGERAVRAALGHLGVADRFGAIVGRRPERPLKPAPEMYHAALAELGRAAEETLGVGDSPHDVQGARAAGIESVGVLGGEAEEDQLFAAGASWVLADLTALPALLALWRQAAE